MAILKNMLVRVNCVLVRHLVVLAVGLSCLSFGSDSEAQGKWKDHRLPTAPLWFLPPDYHLSSDVPSLLKRGPDPEAYFELAIHYAQQSQWQRALWASQKLMEVNPRDVNAYLGMAYSYCNLIYPSGAQRVLESGFRQPLSKEAKSELYRTKGDVYLYYMVSEEGNRVNSASLTQAETAYRAAITYDASNCLAQIGIVRVMIAKGNLTKANHALDRAQANQRTRREKSLVFYYRGLLLEKQGKAKEAEKNYLQALNSHAKSFRTKPTTGDWVVSLIVAAGLAMQSAGMKGTVERLFILLSKSRVDEIEQMFLDRRIGKRFVTEWKQIVLQHGALKEWHLRQDKIEPLPQTPYEEVLRWRLGGELKLARYTYQVTATMVNEKDAFDPDWKVEKLILLPARLGKR